jgi:hypothetical protein
MIRFLDRAIATPVQIFGPFLFFVLILVAGGLIGLGWQFWPRWLPRASWWPAIGRFFRVALRPSKWRRGGKRIDGEAVEEVDEVNDDEALPDRSSGEFLALADAYAAQGRFAEAVRERLRAIVRTLVDRGIIAHHPEWTVTELVGAAVTRAPAMSMPLREASGIFTDIWYGQRTATRSHDDRMRELNQRVDGDLAALPSAAAPVGAGVA